jgi:hypothetical protein
VAHHPGRVSRRLPVWPTNIQAAMDTHATMQHHAYHIPPPWLHGIPYDRMTKFLFFGVSVVKNHHMTSQQRRVHPAPLPPQFTLRGHLSAHFGTCCWRHCFLDPIPLAVLFSPKCTLNPTHIDTTYYNKERMSPGQNQNSGSEFRVRIPYLIHTV